MDRIVLAADLNDDPGERQHDLPWLFHGFEIKTTGRQRSQAEESLHPTTASLVGRVKLVRVADELCHSVAAEHEVLVSRYFS